MNCVYHAWVSHARWLGVEPPPATFAIFRTMYRLGQNKGGMYGGCAPLTIHTLSLASGLQVARVQHHPFFDRPAMVAGAETYGQWWMSKLSSFGEEGIDIEPAIYLWLKGQYAIFSEQMPVDKLAILAIQLRRRK